MARYWFWTLGQASPGDVVAAGAISIRIAQMSGWVSHTLMAIYASIGEAEDGMITLTPPHALVDREGAVPLDLKEHRIAFEDVSFAYGRDVGGVENISLEVAPGQKIGIVGASGAGKSTLVALLLRLYDTEAGRVVVGGSGCARRHAGKLASAHRHGHPGNRHVQSLGAGEHPLRQARRQRG